MQTIIDKDTLCELFKISESSLRNQYKSWPHFYVCNGRDLRSARFILEKVVEHLEENANQGQKARNMDRQGTERRKFWEKTSAEVALQSRIGKTSGFPKSSPILSTTAIFLKNQKRKRYEFL
jgi:hypothetical protein